MCRPVNDVVDGSGVPLRIAEALRRGELIAAGVTLLGEAAPARH